MTLYDSTDDDTCTANTSKTKTPDPILEKEQSLPSPYPHPQHATTVDTYLWQLWHLQCPSCHTPGALNDHLTPGLLDCPHCKFREGECPRCHDDLDDYPPTFIYPDDQAALATYTPTCLSCHWPTTTT